MISKDYNGLYGDVAYNNSGSLFHAVQTLDSKVEVYLEFNKLWSKSVAEFGHIMFLNMVWHQGSIYCSGKANSNGWSTVVSELWTRHIDGAGYGNYCCHLWSDADNLFLFAMVSGVVIHQYIIINPDTADPQIRLFKTFPVPDPYKGTSQGIRFVYPHGNLGFGDATNGIDYPNGRRVAEWVYSKGVSAGQYHEGKLIGVAVNKPNEIDFLAFNRPAFFPRISVFNTHIALCSVFDNKVYIEEYQEPYPAFPVPITQPPVIEPPVVVEPIPEPNKPMKIPDNVKLIIQDYVKKYPVLSIKSGESQDEFENRAREWVRKLAESVVAITKDNTWGCKKSAGPQSKDALARKTSTYFICWDLMIGTGSGHPVLAQDPDSIDIQGQTFIPVVGINWLDEISHPGEEPEPVESDKEQIARLEIELARCIVDIREARGEIIDLRRHISEEISSLKNLINSMQGSLPSDIARKGDVVEGHISVFGQKLGLREGHIKRDKK